MLLKIVKYLKGYVKIRVEGYSPERFFNLCNVRGIVLWGVEHTKLSYEMFVAVKDYKKMRPIVQKTRTKIILLEKHGLPFFLYRFRKRKIFFGGMLFCIVCVYVLSLFVWNIHLEGNSTQTTEEILHYLEEKGIEHGVAKSKVTCEEIETGLRSRYPNMLWVSAQMRGTRIIIQIKENIDEDIVSKIEYKTSDPISIVAERSGVVETIVVRSGTPRVKQGETVEEGQRLVDGYYEIKNDAGEIIRYEGITADADIVITTNEMYQDIFSAEYQKKNYSGRKKLAVRLTFFDKTYEFIPRITYQKFDTAAKQYKFHVTENFYLPFSTELIWYQEYELTSALYDQEEIKKVAEERFWNNYKNILQKGVQIIEKDVRININGKLCHVAGKLKLRVPVTKKIPADIPEIINKVSLEGEN